MTDLNVLNVLAKSISPVTRLTKSYADQKTHGTSHVNLVDRVNFNVVASCVYEPYADHILAAVNALPDLISAARERDAMREEIEAIFAEREACMMPAEQDLVAAIRSVIARQALNTGEQP